MVGDMENTAEVAAAKSALRTRVRRLRNLRVRSGGHPGEPVPRRIRDDAIVSHLIEELDRRDPARTGAVGAYSPLPGEPGGSDLPEQLARTGREVWLPVVDAPGEELRWARWRGDAASRTGAYGIREPAPGSDDDAGPAGGWAADIAAAADVTARSLLPGLVCLLIPCLAVGPDGVRLGQGGGFYDRSLVSIPPDGSEHGKLLACVDHEEFGIPVPGTDLDVTVPAVVTDTGVFPTGRPADHRHP